MAILFAEHHLGMSLDKIDSNAIINYFSVERSESLSLEFKSFYDKPDFKGILKTICAFLNSEGGLLIWGAPKDVLSIAGEFRTVQGPPQSVPSGIINKDGLVNKILDSISYMPIGVCVKDVLMPSGGYVYLIEVQESESKPHQFDKQYPIRLDGQTRSAPHYMVDALFKQRRIPELKALLYKPRLKWEKSQIYHSSNIMLDFNVHISVERETDNDFDIYYAVTSSLGILWGETGKVRSNSDFSRIYVENAASIVAKGFPYFGSVKLEFTSSREFVADPNIHITVLYGGKNSYPRTQNFVFRFNLGYEPPSYNLQELKLEIQSI